MRVCVCVCVCVCVQRFSSGFRSICCLVSAFISSCEEQSVRECESVGAIECVRESVCVGA